MPCSVMRRLFDLSTNQEHPVGGARPPTSFPRAFGGNPASSVAYRIVKPGKSLGLLFFLYDLLDV